MRIAIIGAGITGLALAAALDRAGISCTVFERANELGEVGAGIQLAPNAVRLLHRLGLEKDLEAVGVPSAGIELRHWEHGGRIGHIPLGLECEHRFGAPYYLVSRPDLHAALLRRVPLDAVRLSMSCSGFESSSDGVRLFFSDGTVESADLVVGADGIASTIRSNLAQDEPRFSGQTVYRGLAEVRHTPHLGVEPRSWIWAGPGRHFVCYPVAAGRLINFVATIPTERWDAESWSEPGSLEDVLGAFNGWDSTVHRVIEAAGAVTRWALHVRDADFTWSRERVTLAGDAAHPMLPFLAQGATQGIEDAFALAACLKQSTKDTIPAALERYEAARRPRAALVQRRSGELTRVLHDADAASTIAQPPGSAQADPLSAVAWLFDYDAEQVPM